MTTGSILVAIAVVVIAIRLTPSSPRPLPPLILTTISGEQLSLTALKGRPLVVHFWATSCLVCVHEIPRLKTLYHRWQAAGVAFIAVSMSYDSPARVVNFARQQRLPYPVVMDLSAEIGAAFGNVQLTPSHFLVSPDGLIRAEFVGAKGLDELQDLIAREYKS